MALKTPAWRSRKYLDWVKSLDCAICDAPADDAHHIIGRGHMGGMGTKAPDLMSLPLCRGCHNEIHRNPELWDWQWEAIARTVLRAVQDGVLK